VVLEPVEDEVAADEAGAAGDEDHAVLSFKRIRRDRGGPSPTAARLRGRQALPSSPAYRFR
jgi:hypothetical protein